MKKGSTSDTSITVPAHHQKIVDLKINNPALTTREIGKLTDKDHSTVVRVLKKYGIRNADVEEYRCRRADILAGLQGRILKSITDDDIKKATVLQKATATAILFDKERIERGVDKHGQGNVIIQMNIPEARKPVFHEDGSVTAETDDEAIDK